MDSEERQIHVSSLTDISKAKFTESVEAKHSSQSTAAQIASHLKITTPSLRMDSQCKYAAIARGDSDIYLRIPVDPAYQENIWDHASGNLLVTEAGGIVNDCFGKPLDFSVGRKLSKNKGVIATNGHIHENVMTAVSKAISCNPLL